jgi:hypothetical protein
MSPNINKYLLNIRWGKDFMPSQKLDNHVQNHKPQATQVCISAV